MEVTGWIEILCGRWPLNYDDHGVTERTEVHGGIAVGGQANSEMLHPELGINYGKAVPSLTLFSFAAFRV